MDVSQFLEIKHNRNLCSAENSKGVPSCLTPNKLAPGYVAATTSAKYPKTSTAPALPKKKPNYYMK
jgi:hypothetical protein